ncbi:MAG: DoxX family protein [Acidobacteriota bacterium]
MRSVIDSLPTAARVLLGLVFFVFGLNGFLGFLPMPPLSGAAGAFMGGLAATGYFFPLLKGTEVLVGVALFSGTLVPLALTVLAPITINIVAFHAFLAPSGLPIPLAVLALHLFLAFTYREALRGVLALRSEPSRSASLRPSIAAA